jgi:hypothetical protein
MVLDLQRSAGNAAVVQLLAEDDGAERDRSPVLDVVAGGGGQPLDQSTRTAMEHGLGADFRDVRVHVDGHAAATAQAVQAHAYTVGNDVVFQSGRYQPDTPAGQRMLAHELTHVIQQRSGPVDGTPTGGGISVSHPSDPFEQAAESSADRFMASGGMDTHAGPEAATPVAASVQRTDADEGTAVEGLFVQRADEEEEETMQGAFVQRTPAEEEEEREEPVAG